MREAAWIREIAREAGDQSLLGHSLVISGTALAITGRYPESSAALDDAIAAFRAANDCDGLCLALLRSNLPLAEMTRSGGRVDHLIEALELAQRTGNVQLESEILNDLALSHAHTGDYPAALEAMTLALDGARATGDPSLQVYVLTNMASLHGELGSGDQGEPWIIEALHLARTSNVPSMELIPATSLCQSYVAKGRLDDAIELAISTLDLAEAVDDVISQAELHRVLADVFAQRGDRERALHEAHRARRVAEPIGAHHIAAAALLVEARCSSPGSTDDALLRALIVAGERLAADGAGTARRLEQRAELHHVIALIYEARGQLPEAVYHLRLEANVREQWWRNASVSRARQIAAQLGVERAQDEAERERRRSAELATANAALAEANRRANALLDEVHRQAEQLRRLSTEDPLTGLANRRHLSQLVAREVARAERYRLPYCVALADVDHFKSINDAFGHAAGDSVLATIAHILRDAVRDTDTIARFGGEEFAISLPETTMDDAAAVAERLRAAVERHRWSGQLSGIRPTISVGIASFETGSSTDRLFARADDALYGAKHAGRNQVRLASSASHDAEPERTADPTITPVVRQSFLAYMVSD